MNDSIYLPDNTTLEEADRGSPQTGSRKGPKLYASKNRICVENMKNCKNVNQST